MKLFKKQKKEKQIDAVIENQIPEPEPIKRELVTLKYYRLRICTPPVDTFGSEIEDMLELNKHMYHSFEILNRGKMIQVYSIKNEFLGQIWLPLFEYILKKDVSFTVDLLRARDQLNNYSAEVISDWHSPTTVANLINEYNRRPQDNELFH